MEWIVVAVAVSWVMVVVVGFLCYRLVTALLRQHGTILKTLDRHEELLATDWRPRSLGHTVDQEPIGLDPGTAAPAFTLPSLKAPTQRLSLEEFRGRNVFLLFIEPGCSFCNTLAPKLARLPIDGDNGRPIPVVLTTGSSDVNQKFVATYGLRCPVLLAEAGLYREYRVNATPMGYLIDGEGRIASKLTTGVDELIALATNAAPATPRAEHTGLTPTPAADGLASV